MATDTRSELQDFQKFVASQLTNEGPVPSPDECVELWREQREDLAAIRQGLAEADAGLGRPYREVIDELLARDRAASTT
jgi:hypothetical protein